MTPLTQSVLFLSSYAPLFGVLALLDSFGKGWPSMACLGVMVAGIAAPAGMLIISQRLQPQTLKVSTARVRDADVLAYIVSYLVPFALQPGSTTRQQTALGVVFLLLAVLYVHAELFYVNPLLALVGYRLFEVVTPRGASVVLLTHRRFIPPETSVTARRLSDYVYLEVES